jgi:hypothetical protein
MGHSGFATTGYEKPPPPAALGSAAGTGCPRANCGFYNGLWRPFFEGTAAWPAAKTGLFLH